MTNDDAHKIANDALRALIEIILDATENSSESQNDLCIKLLFIVGHKCMVSTTKYHLIQKLGSSDHNRKVSSKNLAMIKSDLASVLDDAKKELKTDIANDELSDAMTELSDSIDMLKKDPVTH